MAKKNRSLFEIERDKTIRIAKDLKYIKYFPEIKQRLKEAKTSDELSRIMCTYRHYLIEKEYKEEQLRKKGKEKLWITIK